jgi:hypothetical protein
MKNYQKNDLNKDILFLKQNMSLFGYCNTDIWFLGGCFTLYILYDIFKNAVLRTHLLSIREELSGLNEEMALLRQDLSVDLFDLVQTDDSDDDNDESFNSLDVESDENV